MTSNAGDMNVSRPAEAGFAPDLMERFEIAREAGTLPNLHGVVAARHGRIFFEHYLAGPDSARARPLGLVRFGPDVLHDLRSVTKSIVGLLYGIAIERECVPRPEEKLLEQFPEYADLGADTERNRLTVQHVLTMTLGTEWDELSLPYTDRRNSEIAMDRAADRYRYILERPIVEPPGVRWIYNGGATALLARLIAKGTGQTLEEFARAVLFEPLGISRIEWMHTPDGEASAASGLRMAPRDLARIGMLLLQGGRWNGLPVVPDDWLDASFTSSIATPYGGRYGYHWYLGAVARDAGTETILWEKTVSAIGNGGQRLVLLKDLEMVVVITAGNYDAPDQARVPMTLLRDVLLPALRTG